MLKVKKILGEKAPTGAAHEQLVLRDFRHEPRQVVSHFVPQLLLNRSSIKVRHEMGFLSARQRTKSSTSAHPAAAPLAYPESSHQLFGLKQDRIQLSERKHSGIVRLNAPWRRAVSHSPISYIKQPHMRFGNF